MTPEQSDALQRIVEFGELQLALDRADALATECAALREQCNYWVDQFDSCQAELKRERERLAEAERLLRSIVELAPGNAAVKYHRNRIDAFLAADSRRGDDE